MTKPMLQLIVPELLRLPGDLFNTLPRGVPQRLATGLARAEWTSGHASTLEAQVMDLAGLPRDRARDVPVGAYAMRGETHPPDQEFSWWMRCDPVHLRPDRDQLLLFHPQSLQIQLDEARALVEAINAHFSGEGWRLHVGHSTRWYVSLEQEPALRTYDLAEVCGRAIRERVPTGTDARKWRSRMNEMQMLMHGHAINAAREARGQPTINGTWLWGSGCAVAGSHTVPWHATVSDEPFARGLARAYNLAVATPSRGYANLPRQSETRLVVLSTLRDAVLVNDAAAIERALGEVVVDWIMPVLDALAEGEFGSLAIYPCDGRAFQLTRAGLRRFWRRGVGMTRWLLPEQ